MLYIGLYIVFSWSAHKPFHKKKKKKKKTYFIEMER
jgi:hypothetical protein